jgi:GT2 family glycosyltransferase
VVESINIFPADIYYGNIFQRVGEEIVGKFCPPGEAHLLEALSVYCLPHQAMFSSRKIFDAIGLFSKKYQLLSDYDWYSRAFAEGYSLRYLDLDISVYYMGGASSNTSLRLKEFYEIQNSSYLFKDPKTDYLRLFMVLQKINYFENLLKGDKRLSFSSKYILDGYSPRENLYRLQNYLAELEMYA